MQTNIFCWAPIRCRANAESLSNAWPKVFNDDISLGGKCEDRIASLLDGDDGFYDDIFQSLGLHVPAFTGRSDSTPSLGKAALGSGAKATKVEKQARVYELIRAYRVRGHLLADTNPLGYEPRNHTELDPASYGLTVWDLDRMFFTGGMAGVGGGLGGNPRMTLRDILDTLWDTYTGHVGSEFMHISSPAEKRWLIERIEPQQFREPIDTARKKRIFEKLNEAEALEQFIHTKYIGHKRFSLEGAETMIPLLDAVLSDAADQETEDVVIGMAHRGRLNVLTNIMGKPYDRVFGEFEGTVDPDAVQGSGDVKYHMGQTGTHTSPNGATTRLTLASNPSHLEAVNPVVEGMVRAKQQRVLEAHPVPEALRPFAHALAADRAAAEAKGAEPVARPSFAAGCDSLAKRFLTNDVFESLASKRTARGARRKAHDGARRVWPWAACRWAVLRWPRREFAGSQEPEPPLEARRWRRMPERWGPSPSLPWSCRAWKS